MTIYEQEPRLLEVRAEVVANVRRDVASLVAPEKVEDLARIAELLFDAYCETYLPRRRAGLPMVLAAAGAPL